MANWIGLTEAADILGVSTNTVRKLVREGTLRAYEIAGVQGWRFKRDDVEGLIKPVEPDPKPAGSKKKKSK